MLKHHDLLRSCIDAAFASDASATHAFGTCDDNALLLCEAAALPRAVVAALNFSKRLPSATADPTVTTRLGLADGVERWEPGKRWIPEIFGTAATTAQQLANIARAGQIVCPTGFRDAVDLEAIATDATWSESLKTRLEEFDAEVEVAAIVGNASEPHVWHLDALRADLRDAAGLTAEVVKMVSVVSNMTERLGRDPSTLTDIKSHLKILLDSDRPEAEPSPLLKLHRNVDKAPQLKRLMELDRAVSRVVNRTTSASDLFRQHTADLVSNSAGDTFKLAHSICKESLDELTDSAWSAHKLLIRWSRSTTELEYCVDAYAAGPRAA